MWRPHGLHGHGKPAAKRGKEESRAGVCNWSGGGAVGETAYLGTDATLIPGTPGTLQIRPTTRQWLRGTVRLISWSCKDGTDPNGRCLCEGSPRDEHGKQKAAMTRAFL